MVLQDEVDTVLAVSLQETYWMPKDVLRTSGRYARRVDKYPPLHIQLLLNLIGDNFKTRGQIFSNPAVGIFRITGPE